MLKEVIFIFMICFIMIKINWEKIKYNLKKINKQKIRYKYCFGILHQFSKRVGKFVLYIFLSCVHLFTIFGAIQSFITTQYCNLVFLYCKFLNIHEGKGGGGGVPTSFCLIPFLPFWAFLSSDML